MTPVHSSCSTRVPGAANWAQIDLSLELNKWAFQPDNTWSLDASVVRSDTDDLQHLFGWAYPAHGILTGEFHGRGTAPNRSSPACSI